MGSDEVMGGLPVGLLGLLPGGLPGVGSVEAVSSAARGARALADQLRDAGQQARSIAGVDWRSAAAGAFRDGLDQCLRDVEACASRLDAAAWELARFAAGAQDRLAVLRRLADEASP